MGVFHRIGLAGAAAVLDADTQAHDLGMARLVSSVIRIAAASVSFMTCGRGLGFGLAWTVVSIAVDLRRRTAATSYHGIEITTKFLL